MEQHLTFEVKVLLEGGGEQELNDKRAFVFAAIQRSLQGVAAGTQISELTPIKKEQSKYDEHRIRAGR